MDGVLFFGCWNDSAGHYLRFPDGRHVREKNVQDFPCLLAALDSGLLPPNQPQVEGRATLCVLNGWTLLAFWDRSGDSRGGSNSVFLVRGALDFDAACAMAREAFPAIWSRFTFIVTFEG